MGAISETELRIILSHVCDYDVIKLDGELPHLKEKSYIMKERLQKSHENILGPFCKLDELLIDKISSYVEPRWLENLDRAALELSRRSEYMREKIEADQKTICTASFIMFASVWWSKCHCDCHRVVKNNS